MSLPIISYDEITFKNDNGLLHREDGPAIIHNDGTKEWYLDGNRHRVGGPAYESYAVKEWWINGKKHREDGPAIERHDKQQWYLNGKLHREDGPAEIDYGFNKVKKWYKAGQLHREDGPAIEPLFYGKKEWWFNGQRHRADGPAIEDNENCTAYYFNGMLHRIDGPAYVDRFGAIWVYEGKRIECSSQEKFEQQLKLKSFWK